MPRHLSDRRTHPPHSLPALTPCTHPPHSPPALTPRTRPCRRQPGSGEMPMTPAYKLGPQRRGPTSAAGRSGAAKG